MILTLRRQSTGDQGTFGLLDDLTTGELPWRDNHPSLSCIPAGTYAVEWTASSKQRPDGTLEWPDGTYEPLNVPGRDGIRIHSGNFCGDITKGWQSHVEGCIILGYKQVSMLNNKGVSQEAISDSRESLASFNLQMNKQPFTLVIEDIPDTEEAAA